MSSKIYNLYVGKLLVAGPPGEAKFVLLGETLELTAVWAVTVCYMKGQWGDKMLYEELNKVIKYIYIFYVHGTAHP